jgi:diguanylate cyclase (GGDEF)-like protein
MRLFGRHDLIPAAGLAAALVVAFSEPVGHLLDSVRAVEEWHGLHLLPALAILAFVFMLHQLWKRQELRARSLAANAAAREATERAADMGRLVALGQDLGRSLDPESIRTAAAAHLPQLAPGRALRVTLRSDGFWSPLVLAGAGAERQRGAARASVAEGVPVSREVRFPMLVAEEELGVVTVSPEPPLSVHQRSMMTAAAALLAVSLKNAALLREVHETSVRDVLTGCFNRRHALEVIDSELRRARRSGAQISLLMFDLDRFKAINDGYGHLCGDAVLTAVGARMTAVLRGGDLKCRYGGEEFLVLLVDTPLSGACRVAEVLRNDIEAQIIPWREESVRVTASVGVTAARPDEVDGLALIARADDALYLAKQRGRNRVCVADDMATVVEGNSDVAAVPAAPRLVARSAM